MSVPFYFMRHYLYIRQFVVLLCMLAVLSLTAVEPVRGYRGFVDAAVDLGFPEDYHGDKIVEVYYGVSTSHGFQFNPHLFIGAGVMCERVHRDGYFKGMEYPIFAQARTDWTFGKFPLYGDIRIGGVVLGDYRMFVSPTVGYRFNWGRKMNLNLGLGMNFRTLGWGDEKTLHPQFAIRLGIDF